jgi:hypothetical protein
MSNVSAVKDKPLPNRSIRFFQCELFLADFQPKENLRSNYKIHFFLPSHILHFSLYWHCYSTAELVYFAVGWVDFGV